MPPRAMWTGQLRLSLVTLGVRLYSATESASRVSMHQLHRGCHHRLKQKMVCPEHGEVGRDEIVKGYEYEKGSYVIIEKEELDALKLETTKTIDLVQFVEAGEIGQMYVDSPYYLGPDGPVAEEAFRVIREALSKTGRVGIGKLVLQSRERLVALRPKDTGILLTTLRYESEVRSAEPYFKDIRNGEVDAEQLELAETIIERMSSSFDPAAFKDRYKDAFFELVKEKVEGAEPVEAPEEAAPPTYNFMEALKRSVEEEAAPAKKTSKKKAKTKRKPAAKSEPGTQKKKTRRKSG